MAYINFGKAQSNYGWHNFAGKKVFEYFRSEATLRLKNFSSLNKKKEDSFQVWVEVKWERVSPRVNKQMKGSEQLKFIAERWVFRPRLVTWPRHVTEQVALQPIGKSSKAGSIKNFVCVKLNLEIVQF